MLLLLITTTWLLTAVGCKTISNSVQHCGEDLTATCQNLTQAVHCQTFEKCLRSVWTENRMFDSTQEGCKQSAGELRNMVKQKQKSQELQLSMSNLCSYFSGTSQTKCRQTISTYVSYIMDIVTYSRIPLHNVLPILGLCKNEKGMECTVCETLVVELTSVDKDKHMQVNFMDFYEKNVCQKMGLLVQDCMTLVKEHADDIFQKIAAGADPATLCSSRNLCQQPERMTVPIQNSHAIQTTETMECTTCKVLAEEIPNMELDAKIETDLKVFLKQKVCSTLGPVSGDCNALVDEHGVALFDAMLASLDTKTICITIDVCIHTNKHHTEKSFDALSQSRDYQEQMECTVCKLFHEELANMFKTNNKHGTGVFLHRLNNTICTKLGPLEGLCTGMAETQSEMVFKQLSKIPKLCDVSNVCPRFNMDIVEDGLSLDGRGYEYTKLSRCIVCEFIMSQFNVPFKDSPTVPTIKALEEICNEMPNTIQLECESFVEYHITEIESFAEQGVHPGKICRMINVCDTAFSPPSNLPQNKREREHDVKLREISCDICMDVFQYLDRVLLDNSTVAEISKALKEICTFVPADLKEDCNQVMTSDTKKIIKLLIKDSDPSRICKGIEMCPETREVVTSHVGIARLQDKHCDFCLEMCKYLGDVLQEPKTENVINTELETFCHFLPDELKPSCISTFDKFGPKLVRQMVKGANNHEMCQKAGWCLRAVDTTMLPIIQLSDKTASSSSDGSETCSLCKAMMTFLDQILEEQSTVEEIKNSLEAICSVMPTSIRDTCDALIDEYAPQLIEMLVKMVDPVNICEEIRLCSSQSVGAVDLLGGSRCEQGPSFWCSSTPNANLCNAEKYCALHNWREN